MAGNRHIIDRRLPERSKLMFYFPKPQDDFFVVHLPFFENIKIKESKKAKYQKYSPISRSSNLYTYLGADSRKIDLQFSMTLAHILEEYPYVNSDKYILEAKQDFGTITKESFKGSDARQAADMDHRWLRIFQVQSAVRAHRGTRQPEACGGRRRPWGRVARSATRCIDRATRGHSRKRCRGEISSPGRGPRDTGARRLIE